jgi:hypothetical protein
MSNDSLTAMYDWDYVKCRQCGGNDLAEIKFNIPDSSIFDPEAVLNCN